MWDESNTYLPVTDDLDFDDVSGAAMPRPTRVYTGFYPDTLRRKWEGRR